MPNNKGNGRQAREIPQEALVSRPDLPTDAQGRPIGPDGRPMRLRRKKVKKKGGLGFLIPVIGLLVGAVLVAWPLIDDWMRQQDYNGAINEAEAVSSYDTPEYRAMWEQALLYNRMMANALTEKDDPSTIKPYEEQLASNAAGLMSWIEIPALSVKLPIYHGSSEASLMAGVGHIDTTSLPTGVADTGSPMKCVISGHSGMSNQRMFDDIDSLKPGDRMALHTIGHESYYEVVYSEVVEPTELEKLKIEPEDDELVLVTCTPYGINTHRLLVHAHETNVPPEALTPMEEMVNYLTKGRNLMYFIGFLVLFLIAVVVLTLGIIRAVRKKSAKRYHEAGKRNAGQGGGIPAAPGQTPPIGANGKPMRLVRKKKVKKGRKKVAKPMQNGQQNPYASTYPAQQNPYSANHPAQSQPQQMSASQPVYHVPSQPMGTGNMAAMPQQTAAPASQRRPAQPAQQAVRARQQSMPPAPSPSQTSSMPRPSKQAVMRQAARQINSDTDASRRRNFARGNDNEASSTPPASRPMR